MIRSIRFWSLLVAIVLLAVVLFFAGNGPRREVAMPDGTVLRVERVIYGRRDDWVPEPWFQKLKLRIIKLLPNRLAPARAAPGPGASSWNQFSEVHTNIDALQVWITRRNPVTGQYVDSKVNFGVLVDEHGCPLLSTQTGGKQNAGTNGAYILTWLTFEAFPRDQRQFRLRLYDWINTNLVGEFVIKNPARQSHVESNWTTQPLPATQRSGEVSFTLTGITIHTNDEFLKGRYPNVLGPREILPAFTVTDHGEPSGEWWAGDFDLWDSTGNFASVWPAKSRYLCTDLPAWKLVVRFYGTERSALASNETWTLKGIKVPGPGESTPLNVERELMGMKIRAISLAGAGETIYTNNYATREIGLLETSVPATSEPLTNSMIETRSVKDAPKQYTYFETYRLSSASLAIVLKALVDDRVLTVTAIDEEGRSHQLHEWYYDRQREADYVYRRYEKNPSVLLLDLPPGVKKVDLAITMHRPRVVEFIVKPPSYVRLR